MKGICDWSTAAPGEGEHIALDGGLKGRTHSFTERERRDPKLRRPRPTFARRGVRMRRTPGTKATAKWGGRGGRDNPNRRDRRRQGGHVCLRGHCWSIHDAHGLTTALPFGLGRRVTRGAGEAVMMQLRLLRVAGLG